MEYVYAALLLHKLGKPVDEEHMKKVISATGSHVDEAKIKTLIAALNGVDIDSELARAGEMAAAPTAAATPKAEEKKEVKVEESAAGLGALFG